MPTPKEQLDESARDAWKRVVEALSKAREHEAAQDALIEKARLDRQRILEQERLEVQRKRQIVGNAIIAVAAAGLVLSLLVTLTSPTGGVDEILFLGIHNTFVPIVVAICGIVAAAVRAYFANRQRFIDEELAESAEQRAREQPEKPKLAWDVGRAKLEKYLDRNQSYVAAVGILTCLVMLAGFGVIVYGLVEAFGDQKKLPVALVSTASGVLVSFIGGTFLLLYKSLLIQSKDNMLILERINSVGMSMSVIDSIRDDSSDLRQKTTAELAKRLLTLYGPTNPIRRTRK